MGAVQTRSQSFIEEKRHSILEKRNSLALFPSSKKAGNDGNILLIAPSPVVLGEVPVCTHQPQEQCQRGSKSHWVRREVTFTNTSSSTQEFRVMTRPDPRYEIEFSVTKGVLRKGQAVQVVISFRAFCTLQTKIPVSIYTKRRLSQQEVLHTLEVQVSSEESEFLDFNELRFRETIFSGNHATLRRAVYRGRNVAVKVFRGQLNQYWDRVLFDRERKFLLQAQGKQTVNYVGVCLLRGAPPCLIMEFIEGGTLHQLLVHQQRTLSENTKRLLAFKLVSAVKDCHTHGVFHRDLKASNIMVRSHNTDYTAVDLVLVDFGASSSEAERLQLGEHYDAPGTVTHQAPEGFVSNTYRLDKADVYSVGILIWQIFMQQVPFYGVSDQEVREQALKGVRPPMSKTQIPKDIRRLIRACWSKDPEKRPDIGSIYQTLQTSLPPQPTSQS